MLLVGMVCTPAKRTCSEAEVAPEHASVFDREGVYFAIVRKQP